ncbi:MAG: porphobilinogen synthase [Bdellovibrionia bacterium]
MKRPMRLRSNQHIRDLCAENTFTIGQLVQPLFFVEGISKDEEIPGLKGTKRQTIHSGLAQIEKDLESGVRNFLLFNVPSEKKESGFKHTFSQDAISQIKKQFGDSLQLWVDTCLCSSTSHGHCCVFNSERLVDLEATHQELSGAALAFVQAGADGISPSDMMDGRVAHIRNSLDVKGFSRIPIMSYSTKFASQFYGPFRAAAHSAPQFGDRKAYQIDVRNRTDAIEASVRCAEEGADLLMVKPGMTSADLIAEIHTRTGKPVGAYQVSGEYASLVLLAEKGLVSFDQALLETWNVLKRAGAQYIITYGAREAKRLGVGS